MASVLRRSGKLAGLFGGLLLLVILSFVAVILSFTKWNSFVPKHLREMSGVDVVPESNSYYWIGAVLGVVAVLSLGSGVRTVRRVIGWLVGISVLASSVMPGIRYAVPHPKAGSRLHGGADIWY